MNGKNIITNISLEQYNKRYKVRPYRLLKYTKREVEEFDKKNKTPSKSLLYGRRWALIKDTYYEIPKPIRFTWFRNLNVAAQAGICLLGAGVIATSITLPLVLNNRNEGIIVDIDASATDIAEIDSKTMDEEGNFNVIIKSKQEDKEITGVEVKIGDTLLKEKIEYDFKEQNGVKKYKVVIFKETLKKYKGKVVITPKAGEDPKPTKSSAINWTNPIEKLRGKDVRTICQSINNIIEFGKIADHPNIEKEFADLAVKGEDISENKDNSILFYYGKLNSKTGGTAGYILSNDKISFEDNDVLGKGLGLFTKFAASTFKFTNIDTSKLTKFNDMFGGCTKVNEIDVSSFDTSDAVTMDMMFCECGATEINISGFNIGKLKSATDMFSGSTNLKTIYADENLDFSKKLSESIPMFQACNSLIGEEGSTISKLGHISKFAHLDTIKNPGFFSKYSSATNIVLDFNEKDGIYINKTPVELKSGAKYSIIINVSKRQVQLLQFLNKDTKTSAKGIIESASLTHNDKQITDFILDEEIILSTKGAFTEGTLKFIFKVAKVAFAENSFTFISPK